MKSLIKVLIVVGILATTYLYRDDIMRFYFKNFSSENKATKLEASNDYYRDYNLSYLSATTSTEVNNDEELMDLYYSIINNGIDKFTFYCPEDYENCINDVVYLSNNQELLSNINSFVHPYNSFNTIKTEYDNLGRVTLEIDRSYDEDKIKAVNEKMQEIIDEEIKDEDDPKEIIKIVHDYIINNAKYDEKRADDKIIEYDSTTAYGVLLEGYGLCGGYTDAMALFLDYYEIPNFKVVSDNHIWNAVYLDGEWYHLDLTWDDPVSTFREDILEYTFFLISTYELEHLDTNQHVYNKDIFKELA